MLGLRWQDVDLKKGTARVAQTLHRGTEQGTLAFQEPKTRKSAREIVLPEFAVKRLRAYRQIQNERRLQAGPAWQDFDLICDRGDGRPLYPDHLTERFKKFAVGVGLPAETRLHDLRHACATLLLEQGVNAAAVSAMLGHSTVAFTLDRYVSTDRELSSYAYAFTEGLESASLQLAKSLDERVNHLYDVVSEAARPTVRLIAVGIALTIGGTCISVWG